MDQRDFVQIEVLFLRWKPHFSTKKLNNPLITITKYFFSRFKNKDNMNNNKIYFLRGLLIFLVMSVSTSVCLSAQSFDSPKSLTPMIKNLDPDLQTFVLNPNFFKNIDKKELQTLVKIAQDKKKVSNLQSSVSVHKRLQTWMKRNLTSEQISAINGKFQLSTHWDSVCKSGMISIN